jgi:hypothetical protein
MQEVEGRCSEA